MGKEKDKKIEREYYPYFKLFPEEWLSGSIRWDCNLEERGYFVDLLALASRNRKDRGCFTVERGVPMAPEMIATALYIDVDSHKKLWKKMIEQERISQRGDGVYCITNFKYYQQLYRRTKKEKEIAKGEAIRRNEEESTRKKVRRNPVVATDELIKLSEGK